MSRLRVGLTMSLDGYVAGPNQDEENPLGVGGLALHEWMFRVQEFRQMHGQEGGDVNASSTVLSERWTNIGATIMGRNMFGPVRGPWPDETWRGWWGEDPPFHHPVFVLTHYPRGQMEMEGGTIFHFVSDGIESALQQARDAARTGCLAAGRRIGGQPVLGRRARGRDRHLDRSADPRRRRAPPRRARTRGTQAQADPSGRRARRHAHQVRDRLTRPRGTNVESVTTSRSGSAPDARSDHHPRPGRRVGARYRFAVTRGRRASA